MQASRRTQPHRKGARVPGPVLDAMKRGRTASGFNPADVTRMAHNIAALTSKRPSRKPRPKRTPRPPR